MKKIILTLTAIFMCITAHAKTETLNWYIGGNIYATTTCESGNDILLPTTPTKRGYTFKGWASYIPIEYLESTGTQWIDTNVQFNSLTMSFDIVFETNYIPSNYTFLFGAGSSSSENRFWLIVGSNNTQIGYGTQYYDAISVQNKKIRYKADIDETNAYFSFIDTSANQNILYVTKNKQNFVTNNNIFLFRTNRVQVSSDSTYRGKIYSCKIYDNDILIRDFIPVLDYNGIPCLFDRVEGKFYYNQGTGQFIAGSAI